MAGKTKLLAICGAMAAVGAAALLKRDKVAALLPSRTGGETPVAPVPPPQQSNYDAPGPVANTATPVPAPDRHETPPPAIDEVAEEEAAAAEAGAIGGTVADYAGPDGEPADEAFRPLAEAGEGESEGEEQSEAALEENAEFRDDAPSDAERQIEDTIEEAGQPSAGETPEPLVSEDPGPASKETDAQQPGAQETFLPPEPPATSDPEPAPESPGKDDSDDWRTWSGRSVKPS